MAKKGDKIILKIFDVKKGAREKRAHNCTLCQVYKREIAKGNSDAMQFYTEHVNEIVRKNNGATIVLEKRLEMGVPHATIK